MTGRHFAKPANCYQIPGGLSDREEISAIDEECAKPENAVNSAKLNELAARQQECRERLETCYETWEDLSMQLDGAKDS